MAGEARLMILNRVQHESGENTCLTMLLSQAGHQSYLPPCHDQCALTKGLLLAAELNSIGSIQLVF